MKIDVLDINEDRCIRYQSSPIYSILIFCIDRKDTIIGLEDFGSGNSSGTICNFFIGVDGKWYASDVTTTNCILPYQ